MYACDEDAVDMKSLAFAVGRNNQTCAGLHLQVPTARLARLGFWHAMKIGGRPLSRLCNDHSGAAPFHSVSAARVALVTVVYYAQSGAVDENNGSLVDSGAPTSATLPFEE